jgi:ribonuclease P protein component
VQRNRAKRLLKAVVLENENKLSNGKYIFVAKPTILDKDFKSLGKDFNFAIKRLNLYKVPFI